MLKRKYPSMDEVPEELRAFYKEAEDGTAILDAEESTLASDERNRLLKTIENVRKEARRKAPTTTSDEPENDPDPSPTTPPAGGDPAAEWQVKLTRAEQRAKTAEEKAAKAEELVEAEKLKHQRFVMRDKLRAAALAAGALPEAVTDLLTVTENDFTLYEDGNVFSTETAATPKEYYEQLKKTRPHYFPQSEGSGATGGKATSNDPNPWSAEHWSVTAQHAYEREHGTTKAAEMAKRAGVTLGALKPKA